MRRKDHDEVVRELRDRVRSLERQNQELLDRLMHTRGQTWMLPPAELPANGQPDEDEGGWISDPSQIID